VFPDIYWSEEEIRVQCRREQAAQPIRFCDGCSYFKGVVFSRGVNCSFPANTICISWPTGLKWSEDSGIISERFVDT